VPVSTQIQALILVVIVFMWQEARVWEIYF